MQKGEWEFRTSFLRFVSDKHYIGTERNLRLTTFDGPVNTRSQLNFDLTYGLSSRSSVTLDIPFQIQTYNLHKPENRGSDTEKGCDYREVAFVPPRK